MNLDGFSFAIENLELNGNESAWNCALDLKVKEIVFAFNSSHTFKWHASGSK